MDAIDRKILAVLQEDASLSVAEIGHRVGLSSTPCWKRIQKLEADGVIQRRVAVVDQDKVGLGVTEFVSIETGDHSEEWLKHFAEVVGAMPEVMESYRMAGDVDYMLRVVCRTFRAGSTRSSLPPFRSRTSRRALRWRRSSRRRPCRCREQPIVQVSSNQRRNRLKLRPATAGTALMRSRSRPLR